MTIRQIKAALFAHRAGDTASEPPIAEALEQAGRDPALRQWLDDQQSFHASAQASLRAIPVPADLKGRILARRKIVVLPWWRQPSTWAAAAAVVLLAAAIGVHLSTRVPPPSIASYRTRMVSTVLRQYTMDVVTNDPGTIKRFLGQHQAPADYTLPAPLQKLPLSGAGVLSWNGRPVSMICLNGGARGTFFLFVTPSNAFPKDARSLPLYAQVSNLSTVAWKQGGNVYLLAADVPESVLRQYPL